jgi:hypothetical protein
MLRTRSPDFQAEELQVMIVPHMSEQGTMDLAGPPVVL